MNLSNPFRSFNRVLALGALPVILFLAVLASLNTAGLGAYQISDQGNLIHVLGSESGR